MDIKDALRLKEIAESEIRGIILKLNSDTGLKTVACEVRPVGRQIESPSGAVIPVIENYFVKIVLPID